MAFIFGYSNLVASNGSVTAHQVNMTADWIVVDDGSGNTLRVPMTTAIIIDKNLAQISTQPNYRDEAGVANPSAWYSKWINIWAIYNPVTNTIAGLFSLSATAPTLPSGYTHKAWVGTVYSAVSTGNFTSFAQVDNKAIIARTEIVSGGTATTLANLNSFLSPVIPPAAKKLIGDMQANQAPGGNPTVINTAIASESSGLGQMEIFFQSSTPDTAWVTRAPYSITLTTPQTLWYKVNVSTNGARICASGWEY